MAPSEAHASNKVTASAMLGRYAATRSPRATPRLRSPACTRLTCAVKSSLDNDFRGLVCELSITAVPLGN